MQLGARVSSGGGGGSSRKKSSGGTGGDTGAAGLSYDALQGYLNNGTYREQVTGSRNFSAATMERAISESLRAGTISSAQATALRKAASKKPQR